MAQQTAGAALLAPNVLAFISTYQDGICEDMLPFRLLPRNLSFQMSTAKTVDIVLTPWLSIHSKERLPRLINSVKHMFHIVFVWALFKDRVDILASFEYLPKLLQWPGLLRNVMVYAAATGHVPLARQLHEKTLAISFEVDYIAVRVAIENGHLDGLKWLLAVQTPKWNTSFDDCVLCYACGNLTIFQALLDDWIPRAPEAERARMMLSSLYNAARVGCKEVVELLVPSVTQRDIMNAYLYHDTYASVMPPYIDPTLEILPLDSMAARWTSCKLQHVIGTFRTHQDDIPVPTIALTYLLRGAIMYGNVSPIPWLVDTLGAKITQDVVQVCAFHRRLRCAPMLDCFEACNITWPPSALDRILFSEFSQRWNKTKLPRWLSEQVQTSTSVLQRLVMYRGGRVAVLGRILTQLSQRDKRFDQFKTFYPVWLALVQGNNAERLLLQTQCLGERCSRAVLFLLATTPKILVEFVSTAALTAIGSTYARTARAVTGDVLRAVEIEALSEAVLAGRRDVVHLLLRQMNGQNKEAISKARATAIAAGKHTMLEII
ncbi:Aste57867_23716 [Aphanomyces stellatus]|uniref:Aste57867_16069 protein n=1 Tax=Aphanomyces stellatus TaxID=120398 RepID=A0A485KBJ4_9STRA|nr:hypothetical protein As57867_023644 [Aphanomyces stellatus]KAF0688353.1 hypothetical protein As57867_019951 [Aphanomyces stellatus]KAF0692696.1 hypothetical protein As57867_016192 [Aphanomyces stellatus]KAF0692906.1 hypothetical protein As57867_016013 [Aphanomyces stellatus]KAF0701191.1 hypothetical protein As57867_008269 [Aphanomyces stellatus]